jgi:small subunit ribosomal protein S1
LKKENSADFKVIEQRIQKRVASHTAIFREEEEKNVKAATENTSSNSSTNAPAATLGDNNDVLAALKAKMEKQKNNFSFIKSLTEM